MKFVLRLCTVALMALILFPTQALAGKNVFKFFEDIEMHGFVSSSYSYNFNKPVSQTNCGNSALLSGCARIFDQDDNSFKLDNTELVFLKDTPDAGDIGFRFDLTFGFSLPEGAQRARSSATAPGGSLSPIATPDDDFDLQQAYVSWKAPIGKGLQLDLGKFITHVGAEVFDGYDGWNMNFSRTYVFGWGIPFNHTGLRATYEFTDQLTVMGMIANNWEEAGVTDNNTDKTFGLQVGYTPTDKIGILLNWAGGNQGTAGGPAPSINSNFRNIYDIVVDLALTSQWSFQFNADLGTEQNGGVNGDTAKWWGVAGIVRYDVNKWFSMNVRSAHFSDEDGFRMGAINNKMWEITVTPEFRINENMIVRFEYRHDGSNENVFEDNNGLGTDSQDTVAMNALIHF
ncbi:MAG: porin [Nitrospinota bacterium]|nr:porin [Nitrospinota bacterium]